MAGLKLGSKVNMNFDDKISVILPIYNAELYLEDAISSVLKQTYTNFELICLNDGSTDSSLKILNELSLSDNRIRVITRENKGLIFTLNEGISLAESKYIARMDADDICEPSRFEVQIKLMKRMNLAIVGSSYRYIDKGGNSLKIRRLPSSHFLINYLMDFGSPFCHPSIIFNKELVGEALYYDNAYTHCEDYELWLRCRSLGYKLGNSKEVVFNYRLLETSISRLNKDAQKNTSIALINKYCHFTKNINEAEYLLFNRKIKFNFQLSFKLTINAVKCCGPLRGLFVLFYLIK